MSEGAPLGRRRGVGRGLAVPRVGYGAPAVSALVGGREVHGAVIAWTRCFRAVGGENVASASPDCVDFGMGKEEVGSPKSPRSQDGVLNMTRL